ncbi:MAG: hypothetical protein M1549_02435 [Candidatus Dependentiae bacterium]|nr:hypothetical protein [Candidatus Dependentiae bacterium]
MFGKKGLFFVALTALPLHLLLNAAQEQPALRTQPNTYEELEQVFSEQLGQMAPTTTTVAPEAYAQAGSGAIGLNLSFSVDLTEPAAPSKDSAQGSKKGQMQRTLRDLCTYCDLCARRGAGTAPEQPVRVSIETLKKLLLLPSAGSDPAYTVLHRLAIREETVFGTAERATRFSSIPTYRELVGDQEITRYFAEHPEIRRKALRAIDQIRAAQHDFLWLFLGEEEKRDPFENIYWQLPLFKKLNNYTLGLFAGDLYQQIFGTIAGLTPPCAFSGMGRGIWTTAFRPAAGQETLGLGQFCANIPWIPIGMAKGFFQGIWGEIIGHWPQTYSYKAAINENNNIVLSNNGTFPYTSLGDRWWDIQACVDQTSEEADFQRAFRTAFSSSASTFNSHDDPTDKKKITAAGTQTFARSWRGPVTASIMAGAGLLLFDLINVANARATYIKFSRELAAFKAAQARLMSVARIRESLRILRIIAQKSGVSRLEELGNEIAAFEKRCAGNAQASRLIALLKTDTFKGSPSVFSNRTRILFAHRLLRRCKKLFLPALQAQGKIENFVAAAEFYAKHQHQADQDSATKPVCFVDFVDDIRPRLELENCWNILVNEAYVVPIDSIAFGINGSQNAIFSGPNGTGKSTNENAIAHSIFMSRFGIACASRAVMTPFEVCEVHRNEQENIARGNSTFMTQKSRFDAICSDIANLATQRMIIFMDEPLSGTVEAEAARIIYESGRDILARQQQAICIIATHAERVTELEGATNGTFKNYFVEIEEPTAGEFRRKYRLLPGIPHWWFDNPEQRHRFVEWLSTQDTKN